MPFQWANAPESFQMTMQKILNIYFQHGVVVYIDNIFIYSPSESVHGILVLDVLRCLYDHGLAADIEKYEFH